MGCCETMSGLVRDCERGTGGIKKAWIACYDSVDKPTVTAGIISSIGEAGAWNEYEFRNQTGSVTKNINSDPTTGTFSVSSDIVLQFTKMEAQKAIEINAIAKSDTAVIIQDNNEKYWYFGYDNYVTLSAGTGETGTAYDDFNGYNITLNDVSRQLPYEVSETAMQALFGS